MATLRCLISYPDTSIPLAAVARGIEFPLYFGIFISVKATNRYTRPYLPSPQKRVGIRMLKIEGGGGGGGGGNSRRGVYANVWCSICENINFPATRQFDWLFDCGRRGFFLSLPFFGCAPLETYAAFPGRRRGFNAPRCSMSSCVCSINTYVCCGSIQNLHANRLHIHSIPHVRDRKFNLLDLAN